MILVSEVSSSEVYSSTAFIAGPKYSTFTGITEFLDFFFFHLQKTKKKRQINKLKEQHAT